MKNYLAVYVGSATGSAMKKWAALDEKTRKEREQAGMAAWVKWGAENAKSIVVNGSPVGKTKRIGPDGISDITNNIAAYVVVQAESYDAAAKLFVNHPHFAIFPGEAVEVMECLPIPAR